MLFSILNILFGAKVILFDFEIFVGERLGLKEKKKKPRKPFNQTKSDARIWWIAHGIGPCLQAMTTLYKEALLS